MRSRSGSSMAFALIMTMIILMAGMGLALIVNTETHRSIESDESVAAYYMADAGIERQLYDVRKKFVPIADFNNLSVSYAHGGTWFSTTGISKTTTKTFGIVPQDQFVNIDLFDPDNAATPSNVCGLAVTWNDDPSTCIAGKNSELEASYGYWTITGGIPAFPTDFVVLTQSIQGNTTVNPATAPFAISGLVSTRAYRIRLRAFNCNAQNVTVNAFALNGSGQCNVPTQFLSDINLSAEGTYQQATQKIAVTMPKQDVLSGVFSYVLFSECTLAKSDPNGPMIPINCPP